MIYQANPEFVDAFRWPAETPEPPVTPLTGYAPEEPCSTCNKPASEHGQIAEQAVCPGSYVVVDGKQRVMVMPAEVFHEKYTRVENENSVTLAPPAQPIDIHVAP